MEGVYHIYIVKIRSGSFISYIYGVLQCQIPYREGLELGITCLYAPFMLMVELG